MLKKEINTGLIESNNNLNMILTPETFNLSERFRIGVMNRIEEENNNLPSLNHIKTVETIDTETIVEFNNSTSSERREEFLLNLMNYKDSDVNLNQLIENSSSNVRSYINNLLLKFDNNDENLSDIDFYRIGNIFLYYMSNIELDGTEVTQLMNSFRNEMFEYQSQQEIPLIVNNMIINSNEILNDFELLTEDQLATRSNDFFKQLEEDEKIVKEKEQERLIYNRKKLLIIGGGILTTVALSSVGVPPIGGVVIKGITTLMENTSEGVPTTTSSIRLRDILDQTLVNIYKYIK